ncbi:MAG TPA: hypothetical protein VI757_01980 [Bacteroidia bacterium]|nr:hypothetical protein [Bacteroidia bacterium]
MKKYTGEEAAKLPMFRQGRTTRVHAEIAKMKPGDAITIEKEIDWVSKTPPYRLIKRFAKKQGWKFAAGRAPDKTGWNVRREE